MRKTAWPFYCLISACLALSGASYNASPQRLRSPHGIVEFSFTPPRYDMTVDPDKESPTAGLKTAHYNLTFYQPGSNVVVATSDFYDIQASKEQPFPTPISDLANAMIWSPQDDFTVLPLEKWPAEKRKNVRRRAVSMNPDFPWQTKDFLLDDAPLVWMDAKAVAGNSRDECRVTVAKFDAKTGKTFTLSAAASPDGYTMTGATGALIQMKKIIGPCATAESGANFIPECSVLDLSFDRKQIVPCQP